MNLLIRLINKMPFFGPRFWTAGLDAHLRALKEFIFVLVTSTVPIWLSALILAGTDKNFHVVSLLGNGELFLYSTATLAAIAWLNIKMSMEDGEGSNVVPPANAADPAENKNRSNISRRVYPPDKYWFGFLVIIGFLVCSAFYAINVVKVAIDPTYMLSVSKWVYISCLVLYHNILVAEHAGSHLKPFQEVRFEQDQQFISDYAQHRGQ